MSRRQSYRDRTDNSIDHLRDNASVCFLKHIMRLILNRSTLLAKLYRRVQAAPSNLPPRIAGVKFKSGRESRIPLARDFLRTQFSHRWHRARRRLMINVPRVNRGNTRNHEGERLSLQINSAKLYATLIRHAHVQQVCARARRQALHKTPTRPCETRVISRINLPA